jgi:hypothetical protein
MISIRNNLQTEELQRDFEEAQEQPVELRMVLAVRGKTPPFNQRDTNTLRRIAPPTPNPLVGLLKDREAG